MIDEILREETSGLSDRLNRLENEPRRRVGGVGTSGVTVKSGAQAVVHNARNISFTGATVVGNGDEAVVTIMSGATPGGSDKQVQFNDGGSSLGGDAAFSYDKTTDTLTVPTITNVAEGSLSITGQAGTAGSVAGSTIVITGGDGYSTGTGGAGADVSFNGGNAQGSGDNAGGSLNFAIGSSTGAGAVGKFNFTGTGGTADLNFESLTDNRTYTFQDVAGAVALQTGASFTTGSIPFIGSTGLLTQDNAALYWDATNDRLGLGTTSPSYRLVVGPNITAGFSYATMTVSKGAGTAVSIIVGASSSALIEFGYDTAVSQGFVNATNPFGFRVNNSIKMVINASGKVIFGSTTTAQGNVTLYGSADEAQFVIRNHSTQTTDTFLLQDNGGTKFAAITAVGNLTLGNVAVGTSGVGVVVLKSGTAPSTSPADAIQMYSADQAAGNAAPHFRTEAGDVIKLYKVATYTPTNVTTDRSYDANSTTLDEVADVLGSLIADLQATGILA